MRLFICGSYADASDHAVFPVAVNNMKYKILGIITCILLISSSTTLALTPFNNDEQQTKHQFFDTTLVSLPISKVWMKTFGGIRADSGFSVQQTTDGGYIIAGTTESYGAGDTDVWLIKIDSNGNEEWNRTFGGTGSDSGRSVQQTTDGGYIIVGQTASFGTSNGDVWLIKTNGNGNKVWDRTFEGKNAYYDFGNSVQQTTDGGYIIVGDTYTFDPDSDNVLLIKTNGNGDVVWMKIFGWKTYDYGASVQQTTDGGYIITGCIVPSDALDWDVRLIKTDGNGDILWEKAFGGIADDIGYSVQQTTDRGYIIAGSYSYGVGYTDVWLIKTDYNGNEKWNRSFGGKYANCGYSVQQTTDGGYILTGYTESSGVGGGDVWLIKTDNNGNEVWDKTFGGTDDDMGMSVQQTTDGGYIIAGTTESYGAGDTDVWLIKTYENGSINNPPNTPTIHGEINGNIGTSYNYTIQTTDPDQHDIQYHIDWGDNTTTITGLNKSGEEIIVSHTWTIEGTYNVKVKAIDEYYAESDWATLTVTMPCAYNTPILSFLKLLIHTQSVSQYYEQSQKTTITGRILFSPMVSTKTYLIDSAGRLNHSWSSKYLPGESVRWLGNGTILRTIKTHLSGLGGEGGGVQKVTWDGTITWEFSYNSSEYCSHHDIMPLQNGNVLMIAWERKTPAEAIAAGRNPDYISSSGIYPDHIIEVQPTGPTSGAIVWEWHVWDHLIQDYDSSKATYGVVKNHPELVDINYRLSSELDWMHTNSIDYNEEFDQILISVRGFEEIWVIDHSTTTAEAASHTGGNGGKGGDLLYRWGNPEAYRAGTASDKKFFNQHDATWIDKGCPGEGNILVFNNGLGRPAGAYSSVDEIIPPVNDTGVYYLEPGSSYGPESPIWSYTGSPPTSFYSPSYSGARRLKDGNTLICAGIGGNFFEVTSAGTTVWTYTNLYPARYANVFKIVYIPSEESPNQPPYPPRNPAPVNGSTDISVNIELSWTGGDPDSDDTVNYDIYFGTSSAPPKISASQSGTSYNLGRLSGSMKYYWRIVTWDSNGKSTVGPLWDFTTRYEGNNTPPSTPSIKGEAKGSIHTSYDYTIQTTDPDQDDVRYHVDWGDNTTTSTGLNKSGAEITVSHTWNTKGTYNVKVKAIDEYYTESDWATLTVTMPYSYHNPILQFLEWLFQRFPHTFPILRQLFGL